VAIYVAVAAVVTVIGLALGRNSNTTEDDDYKLLLEGATGERPAAVVGGDSISANR
jgi:hypothetical protein